MPFALHVFEWALWSLVALAALFAWHMVLVTRLEERRVGFMTAASAVVLTWLASWFVIADLNKLHLLWMLPTVFVALDVLQYGRIRVPHVRLRDLGYRMMRHGR